MPESGASPAADIDQQALGGWAVACCGEAAAAEVVQEPAELLRMESKRDGGGHTGPEGGANSKLAHARRWQRGQHHGQHGWCTVTTGGCQCAGAKNEKGGGDLPVADIMA